MSISTIRCYFFSLTVANVSVELMKVLVSFHNGFVICNILSQIIQKEISKSKLYVY